MSEKPFKFFMTAATASKRLTSRSELINCIYTKRDKKDKFRALQVNPGTMLSVSIYHHWPNYTMQKKLLDGNTSAWLSFLCYLKNDSELREFLVCQ